MKSLLAESIHLRLALADRCRLADLVALIPMTEHALARECFLFGLKALEGDPSLLLRRSRSAQTFARKDR
jgi:hypothetical protein